MKRLVAFACGLIAGVLPVDLDVCSRTHGIAVLPALEPLRQEGFLVAAAFTQHEIDGIEATMTVEGGTTAKAVLECLDQREAAAGLAGESLAAARAQDRRVLRTAMTVNTRNARMPPPTNG